MAGDLVPSHAGEFLLYQTEDGKTRVQVRIEGETVWLSQRDMVELFQTTKQNVSLHIQNIFAEGELSPAATVKDFLTVQTEGARRVERRVEHYNLDVIISVGYRVKSLRGTQFRIWATQRLREYIVKGFTMDDERLKLAGGGNYFDELLDRSGDHEALLPNCTEQDALGDRGADRRRDRPQPRFRNPWTGTLSRRSRS